MKATPMIANTAKKKNVNVLQGRFAATTLCGEGNCSAHAVRYAMILPVSLIVSGKTITGAFGGNVLRR